MSFRARCPKEKTMRKIFRIAVVAALALGVTAIPVQAQDSATELTAGVFGIGYTTCDECDGVTEIATGGAGSSVSTGLGGGSLALGFYLSPGFALEPTMSLSILSVDDETLTVLGLGIAMPFYFNKDWGHQGMYLSPKLAYNSISADGDSMSQVTLGLGLGTKIPLNEMAALRLQANFDYGFEGDLDSTTSFGAFFGLSVFMQ